MGEAKDTTAKSAEGRKHDRGKPRWGLLPWDAAAEVVGVLTKGAEKYAPDNWKVVPNARERYFDAAIRHLSAWKAGSKLDPEWGFSHLAHAGCCVLFMLSLDLQDAVREATPQPSPPPPGPEGQPFPPHPMGEPRVGEARCSRCGCVACQRGDRDVPCSGCATCHKTPAPDAVLPACSRCGSESAGRPLCERCNGREEHRDDPSVACGDCDNCGCPLCPHGADAAKPCAPCAVCRPRPAVPAGPLHHSILGGAPVDASAITRAVEEFVATPGGTGATVRRVFDSPAPDPRVPAEGPSPGDPVPDGAGIVRCSRCAARGTPLGGCPTCHRVPFARICPPWGRSECAGCSICHAARGKPWRPQAPPAQTTPALPLPPGVTCDPASSDPPDPSGDGGGR